MRLLGTGWQGPTARPHHVTRPAGEPVAAEGPRGGALTQAPQLPSLSRQPAWTTVPSTPSLIEAGQGWTAESWARLRDYMGRLGLTAQAPTSGVMGYMDGRAFTRRVLELTNRERSIRGLPPLQERYGLQWVAQKRSTDMIVRSYFSHTDPDGHDPFWHITRQGVRYRTAGENIAYGQPTPEAVVSAWMNSPGHRANILNPNFGHLGVGAVVNSQTGQVYWTQIFTD